MERIARPLALATFGVAVAIAVAAFRVPHAVHTDVESGMSDKPSRMLKHEAQIWSEIPALKLQITEVHRLPSSPEGLPDAELTWRTIFGVPHGHSTVQGGQSRTDHDFFPLIAAWSAFITAELILWGLGFFFLVNAQLSAYASNDAAGGGKHPGGLRL